MRRGWYDRKPRRVRDLACGDLRIYLDVEVRLVASALWRGEAGAPRVSRGQSLLIVHFQHLLFHSLRLPMVAAKAGVPSLLTLHDFWLLCPQINLLDHRQRISWPIDRRNCIALLRDEIQRKYSWRRLCGWEPTLLTGKVRIPTHPDRLFRSILIAHSV